ncbi:MAG: amidohydrolase family protein, partial [Rhodobiaceae bacterium]
TLLGCVTMRPAALLGLAAGGLQPGAKADFAIVDIEAPWVIDADRLKSKSQNSAIEGRQVQGIVQALYLAGEQVTPD